MRIVLIAYLFDQLLGVVGEATHKGFIVGIGSDVLPQLFAHCVASCRSHDLPYFIVSANTNDNLCFFIMWD